MSYSLSTEQLEAIKDNEPNYFDGEYSQKQKEGFLTESIRRGKLDVIKHFMEQGVKLSPQTYGQCIDCLAEKKKKVKILEYLHSQGVEMSPDNNMGIFKSATALSIENTQYLANFVPFDHNGIWLTLNCIVKRDDFSEKELPLIKYEPILKILLQKCSFETLKRVLDVKGHSSKDDDNNKYVFNLHLALQLADDKKDIKKIKI